MKYILRSIGILVLGLGLSASGWADQRVILNLGSGIPTQANGFSATAGPGFEGGFTYLYGLLPKLEVGVEANEFYFPKKTDRDATTSQTMTNIITGEAVARYSLMGVNKWTPYVQGGVGADRYREDQTTTLAGTEFKGHDQTVRMSESLGVGVDYPLTDSLIAGVNATWHWFEMGKADFGTSVINMPSVTLQLGWKFGK
jgi:opacity protein-like surface antigen